MRVILRENIENLGKKGEIVNVAPGYGRNYLIPKKIAIEVTSRNMKMIAIEQKSLKKGLEKEMASYKEIIDRLNAITLSFTRKTSEKDVIFGSVSSTDIRDALVAEGFDVEKKKIILDEPIKRLGNFTVPIKIFHEERAEIKLEVIKEGEPGVKEDKEPEPDLGEKAATVLEPSEDTKETPVKEEDILEEAKETPEEAEEKTTEVKEVPEEAKEDSKEAEEPEALDKARVAKDEKDPSEKRPVKETKESPQETSEESLDTQETELGEGPEKSDVIPDEAEAAPEEVKGRPEDVAEKLEETEESPEDQTGKTEDVADRPEKPKKESAETKESLEDTGMASEEPEGTAEDKDKQEATSKNNK